MDVKNILEKLKNLLSEGKSRSYIKKGEMYFILIGIDKYAHLNNLNYCKQDSESFLNLWNTNYSIKTKNIYKLYDSRATKYNILSVLGNLSKTISYNDRVVIHFAGHEFTNYKVNFFVPADGDRDNMYSCLSNITINRYIRDIKCSNILMIGNTFDNNFSKDINSDWHNILEEYDHKDFGVSEKQNVIYEQLINFLKKDENKRKKRSVFYFAR